MLRTRIDEGGRVAVWLSRLVPIMLGLVVAMPCAAQVETHPGTDAASGTLDPHLATAPLVRAARVPRGIHLDGVLDEADWGEVQPFGNFIQTDPHEGLPATQPTEVRILYDDDAIYVGARMYESAGSVRKRLGRRDSYLADSDWFYVMLDSYHDHLTAYQFSVNPAGVKRDEITGGGGHPDASWDAVWEVATTTDSAGWTAEMRIPFSQLRFNAAPEQTWGVQFSRRTISDQEVSVLAYTPKSERGGVARYGHLQGLRDIRPGRRMELLPYTVSRAEYRTVSAGNPYRDGSDWFTGAGLDLKYRLTSSLTLDATFNPDFGQVEVDPGRRQPVGVRDVVRREAAVLRGRLIDLPVRRDAALLLAPHRAPAAGRAAGRCRVFGPADEHDDPRRGQDHGPDAERLEHRRGAGADGEGARAVR